MSRRLACNRQSFLAVLRHPSGSAQSDRLTRSFNTTRDATKATEADDAVENMRVDRDNGEPVDAVNAQSDKVARVPLESEQASQAAVDQILDQVLDTLSGRPGVEEQKAVEFRIVNRVVQELLKNLAEAGVSSNLLQDKIDKIKSQITASKWISRARFAENSTALKTPLKETAERVRIGRIQYDPEEELRDFNGPTTLPEIELVKKGKWNLKRAREVRTRDMLGLFNGDVELARKGLIKEDMFGTPEEFEHRVAQYRQWREEATEKWRKARERFRSSIMPAVDPDVQLVSPRNVPGKRMGPPENENQHKEHSKLVSQHVTEALKVGEMIDKKEAVYRANREAMSTQTLYPSTRTLHLGQHVRRYSTAVQSNRPSRPKTARPHSPTRVRLESPGMEALEAAAAPRIHTPRPYVPKIGKEDWEVQQKALKSKFGNEGWNPRKKLSPDAMLHLRNLHESNPELYTTPLLASTFKMSPEAIRRILKSKWLTNAPTQKVQERRERWAKRHDRLWDMQAELGLRPRRWMDRKVDDAHEGAEKVEEDLRAQEVLRKGREENPIWSDRMKKDV